MTIKIKIKTGNFAENKDTARDIRIIEMMPALQKGKKVILDFAGVTGATQSFMHALISEAIREYGENVYDRLLFKNCSDQVREIVLIVSEYMRASE